MTEIDIECDCGRRGVLLLEGEDGYVRHPAGTANCALPPRDVASPPVRVWSKSLPPLEFGGWIAGGAS